MVKNLDVTTFRNGDPIPQATRIEEWGLGGTKWAYLGYDPANGPAYGKLYGGSVLIDPRGIAPAGWHVATDAEWTELANCLGGALIAGGKMKVPGTTVWLSPNLGATNSSGFTGLPNGRISQDGISLGIARGYAFWWASGIDNTTAYIWARHVNYGDEELSRFSYSRSNGLAIRCVKD